MRTFTIENLQTVVRQSTQLESLDLAAVRQVHAETVATLAELDAGELDLSVVALIAHNIRPTLENLRDEAAARVA